MNPKHFLIGVFILMSLQTVKAQNLVADSSFEHNKFIPTVLSSLDANNSWSAPTMGTTDLFCECGKKQKEISEAQVPNNPMGIQKANSGKCYAGFYLFSHHDYHEYLLTQLTSPMTGGVKYDLTFYLSLADYSRATIEQIGVCFLKGSVTYTGSGYITGLKPIHIKINEEVGTDTVEWHKISLEYKAKGGEKFLLIGSFDEGRIEATNVKVPKGVRTRINQRSDRDAYYYIDDVGLRKQPPVYVAYFDTIVKPKIDTLKPTVVTRPTIDTSGDSLVMEAALEKSLVLKNVLFETGKAVLLPQSYPELDLLAEHLKDNPALKVEISGHTDNVGNETVNEKLSELRAKAVCDHLISKSIDPGRMTHKGLGSSMPISPNDTEEGRKQNRRVEFKFLK
jgi:outer membrane protein OmpA-like peptidoglycan-associated protein